MPGNDSAVEFKPVAKRLKQKHDARREKTKLDLVDGAGASQQDEQMVDLQLAINNALADNNEAVIDEEERLMTSAYYG